MPHAQVDLGPVPVVDGELRRRAFALRGVVERPSIISVPGARALWLDDDVALARPELVLRGRELAHIHPDGSLHVVLPGERAVQAIDAGWAERHPLAEPLGVPGLVLLYTPRTEAELDVVLALVEECYALVTGRAARE
jgi:phospholipase/carboxylesterase